MTYTSRNDTSISVVGSLSDDLAGLGVYTSSVTLTKVGLYDLNTELRGLNVTDAVNYNPVTVVPAETTSELTSNFTGNVAEYFTGQSIVITMYSYDVFQNLRTDSSDTFVIAIIGVTSGTDYGSVYATNLGEGVYQAGFQFTVAETYTVYVGILDGLDIKHIVDSPITNILVNPSTVQAQHSTLYFSESTIVAGEQQSWQIQAKDFYSNVVVGTNERFTL